MRIVVHDYAGHPFQAQLSRELARRGHEVRHIYCAGLVGPKGTLSVSEGDPETLSFEPVGSDLFIPRSNLLLRLLAEFRYGGRAGKAMRDFRPDVVLSANSPPVIQARIQQEASRSGFRSALWLQDLYSVGVERVFSRKSPLLGSLLGEIAGRLEMDLANKADALVLISEDFSRHLPGLNRPESRVHVIHNWAVLDETPVEPKENPWSVAHGLHDKFVFLYAGTLGLKHDPSLVIELAEEFRTEPDVEVVVVSEGPGADLVRSEASKRDLKQISVLSFQKYGDLPKSLGASDVLLALLEADAGEFAVPSKVLTYFCSGRPVLLSAPRENLAVRLLEGIGGGKSVPPSDRASFRAAARELYNDPEFRKDAGCRGREFAERAFNIQLIADRFEAVLLG